MKTTDTSEKGLETLIFNALVKDAHYQPGTNEDYLKEYALDLEKLMDFLSSTQPHVVETLSLDRDGPGRTQFLNRLQGEITKNGVIDVLRKGIKHGPASVELFYGTPTPGNTKAETLYDANIFSVTRQLRFSRVESHRALDLCLFINGLPIATFELKNQLTKQTVEDAVRQYKEDRKTNELLFKFGRCVVHFAVDDLQVKMCTHLQEEKSWFLPFNKGYNDGAGNPPNPHGLATDYLWKEILTREGLTDILENYAKVVDDREEYGKKKKKQIFPRYHQLDVVRKLLAHARETGKGHRYLIQHSAGSGKSESIAWLAYQLIGLKKQNRVIFDSVIVVTDRQVLDRQIRDTIKRFRQVAAGVGHAKRSGDLRRFIADGKQIIISTVQKFPFILDDIGDEHRDRAFAIIIDEAHSSQGGRTASKMNIVLSERPLYGKDEDELTIEDRINAIMTSRKMLENASYFAFTATPKNKTLEIFGEAEHQGDIVKHRPFHVYTMKQAIQEHFIVDVLKHYTPVDSYYRLTKTIEDDPLFDTKRTQKKLRRYVESHEHAVRQKAEIMVDHFHNSVIKPKKIGGKARAMVVTNGIQNAIHYYHAIEEYLRECGSKYRAIVAFSGEHEYGGRKVSEATLNGFPGSLIPEKIQEVPYRILIAADKFQTGYDEPLLHTMYVDKVLAGIKAVQTLSRLNRSHPEKHDTFVLDFINDSETIAAAFADYYRTTILSEETDPNKLHDIKAQLDGYQVYDWNQVEELVGLYLGGAERDRLDPILDICVAVYINDLDENGQVEFKGKSKEFTRLYNFLGAILPYCNAEWEKLSIFLNFLIPKLPAPYEEDLSQGILEAIDMESYRVEVRASQRIALPDDNAEIGPVPSGLGYGPAEPELDRLSNIIKEFNNLFGNIDWKDADKLVKDIFQEIPINVAADEVYRNAIKNSDKQNARIEHDKVLQRLINDRYSDSTQLFKQFNDNPAFRNWLLNVVFEQTYQNIRQDTRSAPKP
jgi:type I restriction enzyme R subunit